MSLRKVAKELGVSHTLLVLWRQGKRSLAPDVAAQYHQLMSLGADEPPKRVSTPAASGTERSVGDAPQGIKSPVTRGLYSVTEYDSVSRAEVNRIWNVA
jgi:hypothetical protein